MAFVTPVMEHWLEREIAQWVHSTKDRSDDPSHHEQTLLPRSYILLPYAQSACVFVLCKKKGHLRCSHLFEGLAGKVGLHQGESVLLFCHVSHLAVRLPVVQGNSRQVVERPIQVMLHHN